jgi:hypothetical protein
MSRGRDTPDGEVEYWMQVPAPCASDDTVVLVAGDDDCVIPGSDFIDIVGIDPTDPRRYLPRVYRHGGRLFVRDRTSGVEYDLNGYTSAWQQLG